MEISILGSGSWSTAIASLLSENYDVLIYARNEEDADYINKNHKNRKYLKEFDLAENIKATSNLEDLFKNKYIINGIPTQSIRSVIKKFKPYISSDNVFINLAKGIELGSHKRISEVFCDELGDDISFAVLSGPSHAEEVIKKMPTAVVAASSDINLSKDVQKLFNSDWFRVYSSTDLIGVELGGAIKNTLAFGIGMLDGLGYGDNTKAAVITRGIHEMNRLLISYDANPNTINGLAGVGDLIVTSTSLNSRNYRTGLLIGKGYSMEDAVDKIQMVVEGIPTTKALYQLSLENDIDLPITLEIYKVLYENKNPIDSVSSLMGRSLKSEF